MKFFTCTCSPSASKNGEKGFTLIELLVVIAILGVLAAVAVPSIASLMSAGDIAAAKAEAATVQTAVDAAITSNNLSGAQITALNEDSSTVTPYLRGTIVGAYTVGSDGAINGTGTWGNSTFTWDSTAHTWKKP